MLRLSTATTLAAVGKAKASCATRSTLGTAASPFTMTCDTVNSGQMECDELVLNDKAEITNTLTAANMISTDQPRGCR